MYSDVIFPDGKIAFDIPVIVALVNCILHVKHQQLLNSLSLSDAYMRRWIGSSLIR